MKIVLVVFLILAIFAHTCDQDRQVQCVDDFAQAYPPCKKAAESAGSDKQAILECLKYYNKMRGECWDCICVIAQVQKIKIKGCDQGISKK